MGEDYTKINPSDIQKCFREMKLAEKKQAVQNFLNMVVFETQGELVSCEDLHLLMEEYFAEE